MVDRDSGREGKLRMLADSHLTHRVPDILDSTKLRQRL